ncbi:MAG TPA: zinc-ribbon domain-containing protein [Chloroflexota bacterium]|nr:zinc-ribbon domain-containing protein [Chloroflexota bacterium]
MIRCQACGTENPAGAAFCSQCARKLDETTQAAVAEQRSRHTATAIAWTRVLVAALVVIVIVAVVTVLVVHGV